MIQTEVEIINKLGLHARAAAKFVTLASRFQSEVHLSHNQRRVNGKSIMGVMMLAACKGCRVQLEVDGPDAEQASSELCQLIADRFGEGE